MKGIKSKSAAAAIGSFQNIVEAVVAQKATSLFSCDPIAKRASSTLYITRLAKGSIGFVLEELRPQATLVDTALTDAAALKRTSHKKRKITWLATSEGLQFLLTR